MIYEYTITVPAGTTKSDPEEMEALVDAGILIYGEVFMPAGCHGLVHCTVIEGNFQIWPRNSEETISCDNYAVPIHEYYPLPRGHNLLTIRCWSPNADYDHKVTVRLTVEPPEVADPLQVLRDFVAILKRVMGV